MRTFTVTFHLLVMLILPGLAVQAEAAKPKANKKHVASSIQPKNGTHLTTNMSFDALDVRGMRQSPFGAAATVEADKAPKEFVDYRNDFNDRIAKSRAGR